MDGTVQFLRVYPDNSYHIIWPVDPQNSGATGNVATWNWWGMDSDPLAKGPDGKLYFKVSKYDGQQLDEVYSYDPRQADSPAIRITPQNATFLVNTFMVDSKDHLFIQGGSMNMGGSGDSFLKYYTKGVVAPKEIYYSSTGSTWVRGYVTDPEGNYIIMNGNGIRGMNGMIKATIIDASTVDYKLLFPNTNSISGASWINLIKYYSDTWTSPTAVIKQTNNAYSSTYEWIPEVLTDDVFDPAKFSARVSSYFYSEIGEALAFSQPTWWNAGDLNAAIDEGNLSVAVGETTVNGSTTLGNLIATDPDNLLRELYPDLDTPLFKDWLSLPVNVLASSINFENIGTMVWATDGLYGLYSNSWWGYGGTSESKVIKLLDMTGNPALAVIEFEHSGDLPTQFKINGDYLYYRYSLKDAFDQENGKHRIARKNFVNGTQEELLTALSKDIQINNFDISSDDLTLYFTGLDKSLDEVVGGRIDLTTNTYIPMLSTIELSQIRVID